MKWVSAARTRKASDAGAMLCGRDGVARVDLAILEGSGFDAAGSCAGGPAEMPDVPGGVAHGCYGRRLPGKRRGVGERDTGSVLGCSRGVRRGAGHSAPRVKANDGTPLAAVTLEAT